MNCMPVFIVSDDEWDAKFRQKGIPIVGDDIKAQIGATITHRTLANLFKDRGVKLDRTYQINTGGNTDFLNMLNRDRLDSKKNLKLKLFRLLWLKEWMTGIFILDLVIMSHGRMITSYVSLGWKAVLLVMFQ